METSEIKEASEQVPDGFALDYGDKNHAARPWACVTRQSGDWEDYAATAHTAADAIKYAAAQAKNAVLQAKLDKAVEALQEVDDTLAKLSGSLAELDAALLAQEIAVIALERENIAPLITAKSERDE